MNLFNVLGEERVGTYLLYKTSGVSEIAASALYGWSAAFEVGMHIRGIKISVVYNKSNLHVENVEWSIPQSGIILRVRIWNNSSLVYNRSVEGPAHGVESVPGNVHVQEYTENGHTYYDLPPNISYIINLETIGQ